MFKIVVHRKFSKALTNLEKSHLKRIADIIDTLSLEPVPWRKYDIKKN